MAPREGDECLVARRAVRKIGLKHAFHCLRRALRLDVAIKLATERRMRTEAAADEDVVALDCIAVVGDLHLARQEADLADEMLRTGMMATGEVDVDRSIEGDPRLAPARDLLGVAFRVGGGELASRVAGAGDQTGAYRIGRNRQAQSLDLFPGGVEIRGCYARDQQVLPDRETDIAVAEITGDPGQAAHLRNSHPSDRNGNPDTVELILLLGMNADVRQAIEGRPRQQGAWHRAI